MEGVPRIPMLCVELKAPAASVSFSPYLRRVPFLSLHHSSSPFFHKFHFAMSISLSEPFS